MTQTSKFWHWPDRNIGKRESRVLREEHNKLANEHADLLTKLEGLVDWIGDGRYVSRSETIAARALVAKIRSAS